MRSGPTDWFLLRVEVALALTSRLRDLNSGKISANKILLNKQLHTRDGRASEEDIPQFRHLMNQPASQQHHFAV